MTKIRIDLAYDGTEFHGFQKQAGLRTVQGELEHALYDILGHDVEVSGASRTDAGVHARMQVVNVPYLSSYRVPDTKWLYVLRRRLPKDLVATRVMLASDSFDARHTVNWKMYRYAIDTSPVPDVFMARYATHRPFLLDRDAMRRAADLLIGEHDFTSFCATRAQQTNKVRNIHAIDFWMEGSILWIEVRGNAFLQHMVRIIVGTLLEVGTKRIEAHRVKSILEARDRRKAGPTAPAHGLCLWHIEYPTESDAFTQEEPITLSKEEQ
nr:tRNA pseudouridine(38-40) synthase TruA [Bacilli bacterium]